VKKFGNFLSIKSYLTLSIAALKKVIELITKNRLRTKLKLNWGHGVLIQLKCNAGLLHYSVNKMIDMIQLTANCYFCNYGRTSA